MVDTIILIPADSVEEFKVKVPISATKISIVLTEMIEAYTGTELDEEPIVPIGPFIQENGDSCQVSKETIQIVANYMRDYEKFVSILPEEEQKVLCDNKYGKLFEQEWVAQYIRPDPCQGSSDQMVQNLLYEIVLTAHYLHIDSLEKICCRQIAMMIRGRSPDEIKKIFGYAEEK